MKYQFLKYVLCLIFFFNIKSAFSQATDYSGSLIFGPEVGLGMPKIAYRNQSEGFYFGAFVSINFIEVLSLSAGPIGGYRWKGIGAETSLSLTWISNSDKLSKKNVNQFWLTFNPRAVLSYKSVFASFGPGLYLIKSKKKADDTLWNGLAEEKLGHPARFNYEIGRYGAF